MAKKKETGSHFEIIVILAIVVIVAVTGQVLIHFDNQARPWSGTNSISGFAVSSPASSDLGSGFVDVSVSDIVVNPPSPFIGEPFEVSVKVSNEGFAPTTTPFFVKAEIIPDGGRGEPVVIHSPVPMSLEPGKSTSVSFKIALVASEGPVRIIATADSTGKLDDLSPSNNQRSKTIIITN